MSKNDGGSAFPFMPQANSGEWASGQTGMSLRDWFAGMAMHQIFVTGGWSEYKNVAREAYVIADAMIAERSKNEK